jgi:hypothetical protein
MGRWRIMVLTVLCAAAWPTAAHGQGDLAVEPGWHDFGEVPAGQAAGGLLEVWNDGTEPIALGGIGFDGAAGPFGLAEGGCQSGLILDPGWGCDVGVTFLAPAAGGDHEAVVYVEAEDGAQMAFALLTGSSVPLPGRLVAESAALDFGVVARGATSPSQTVIVRNPGGAPVALSGIRAVTIGGRPRNYFDVTANDCAGALGPGAECRISVAFSPSALPTSIGGRPYVEPPTSTPTIMDASLEVRLQSGAVGLTVPMRGALPPVPAPPSPPPVSKVDYGIVEQDLVRLAERVPRLLRGGPRRGRRLPAFTAPTAGRLTLQVRGVGRQRRVRLAKGALKLESGQRGRLRFSLGGRARKLLRRARKTRVNVMVSFKARADGETFKQALELTIRRPAKPKTRNAR